VDGRGGQKLVFRYQWEREIRIASKKMQFGRFSDQMFSQHITWICWENVFKTSPNSPIKPPRTNIETFSQHISWICWENVKKTIQSPTISPQNPPENELSLPFSPSQWKTTHLFSFKTALLAVFYTFIFLFPPENRLSVDFWEDLVIASAALFRLILKGRGKHWV
jgi:hypothetical protein